MVEGPQAAEGSGGGSARGVSTGGALGQWNHSAQSRDCICQNAKKIRHQE